MSEFFLFVLVNYLSLIFVLIEFYIVRLACRRFEALQEKKHKNWLATACLGFGTHERQKVPYDIATISVATIDKSYTLCRHRGLTLEFEHNGENVAFSHVV